MKFAVFAYNFPHWKTQAGLFNLVMNGFIPDVVILQDKKPLNIPISNYRIAPKDEYLLDPKHVCYGLGLDYWLSDHDTIKIANPEKDLFGVILGARILKQRTIDQFPKGILNIHPGILPGNRGLDNLKWSLVKGLPVGVTAHFIDSRIDMGYIVAKEEIKIYDDDTVRDLYLRQRDLQMKVLIDCMKLFAKDGIHLNHYEPCTPSEKFGIVDEHNDKHLHYHLNRIKLGFNTPVNH